MKKTKTKTPTEKRIVWKLESRKLSELQPHPQNPRQFTEKGMKDLESSIDSIGFAQPININQNSVILSGHARVLKLQEMGYEEVDVYVPDRVLTPKQEEEILVRMNANTAGEFDYDKLANEFELEDLKEWGLDSLPDIEELALEDTVGDDEVPDEPIKAITVKGDLYELGKHRLLCGDSTMIDEVENLMKEDKAQTFFTDPPYGDNVGGLSPKTGADKVKGKGLIKRDSFIKGDDKIDWLQDVFNLVSTFLEEVNTKMVFFKWDKYEQIKSMASAFGEPSACCVWDRVNKASAFFRFQPQHEFCFHWGNQADKKEQSSLSNVWRVPKEQENNELHPTVKPLAIIAPVVEVTTDKNAIVLDLFGGSGSTLVACEKTKRVARLMELDEKFCDVIVKRYIQFCEANNIKPSVKRNGEDCLKEFKQSAV